MVNASNLTANNINEPFNGFNTFAFTGNFQDRNQENLGSNYNSTFTEQKSKFLNDLDQNSRTFNENMQNTHTDEEKEIVNFLKESLMLEKLEQND